MRSRIVDDLMAEVIGYGGFAATRWQAYQHARECALSQLLANGEPDAERRADRCADLFAFGRQAVALTEEEIARRIPWETAAATGLV